ncbi:MAG TPA: hypothetical protein VFE46_11820 [Pirellulales bacterium]|jgi:hypothetical protein|nr:hypothetical protein [Pirellulales bacterium]
MSDEQEFEAGTAISALLDAEISDEQLVQLQQALQNNPAVRNIYVEQCQIHFLLTEYYSESRKTSDGAPVIATLHFPSTVDSSHDAHA